MFGCGEEEQGETMIDLPVPFEEANSQDVKQGNVLVAIEDVTLFAEKTTEDDWGNNSAELRVDYTPSPPLAGDVILETDIIPNEENLSGNTWGILSNIASPGDTIQYIERSENWQSFKQNTGFKEISVVKGYFKANIALFDIKCSIWNDGKTIQISTVLTQAVISSTGEWLTFDFSSQDISIDHNTEYWIKFESLYTGSFWPAGARISYQHYQNTDVYAKGQFDRMVDSPGTDLGDLKFEITFTGDFYHGNGKIITDNIDIGEVPTTPGEWVIEDITPGDSTIVYTAWYSTTGAFTGEEVGIGVIIDGQAITDLKRYWRVQAEFTPNTNRDETPTLQSIKADYTTFRKFNKIPDLGYEPLVDGVSSLTSKVDFFKPASIGKISVQIVMTPAISIWVDSNTLYNKIVKVKLGYVYPGLVEDDYIFYFTGAIDDWDVDDGILNLQLKDLSKDWKLPVPSKWEDSGDDVVYEDIHHTDVMRDIFENVINVRDSGLLQDSFATVKAATPSYKVTRTITKKTEDGKKLVEELRVLLFAFFLPRGDGKIGLKQFDKTEATVHSFTDDNTTSIKWKANSESLINRTSLYYDWDGTGDNEENFPKYDPGDDETSQEDFRAIVPFELKDKWTRAAELSQITDLRVKILEQFGRMPSGVDIVSDVKDIAIEAGDQVLVSTRKAPGSGGAGITDVRFLIISKNLDFEGSKVVFEGLRVAV